jgi:hypothetical protein
MDIDDWLTSLALRIPEGQAWPYNPLTTAEQRRLIALAVSLRRDLERHRRESAADIARLQTEVDMLTR